MRAAVGLSLLAVLAFLGACRDAPRSKGSPTAVAPPEPSRSGGEPLDAPDAASAEPPAPSPNAAAWIEAAELYEKTACACPNEDCAADAATKCSNTYRDLNLLGIPPPSSPKDQERWTQATKRAFRCHEKLPGYLQSIPPLR